MRFNGVDVLHAIDFSLHKREIVTVVGPNGSGKTTLLRLLLGLEPPASGFVKKAQGLRIGYVPQTLTIDRTMPLTVSRFWTSPTESRRRWSRR